MFQSLSARRAWIEIKGETQEVLAVLTSLSARRAWIEMGVVAAQKQVHIVALRKESVDRNAITILFRAQRGSRSPQGERG